MKNKTYVVWLDHEEAYLTDQIVDATSPKEACEIYLNIYLETSYKTPITMMGGFLNVREVDGNDFSYETFFINGEIEYKWNIRKSKSRVHDNYNESMILKDE